jgi:hypothetical protein
MERAGFINPPIVTVVSIVSFARNNANGEDFLLVSEAPELVAG